MQLTGSAMAGIEASALDQAINWFEKELEPANSSIETFTSPAGPTTEDPFFRDAFFHPSLIPDNEPCKAVLHYHLGNTNLRVRVFLVFDLLIVYGIGVGSHNPDPKPCFPSLLVLQATLNEIEAAGYKLTAFSKHLLHRSDL